jgi:hypothetical protein
LAGRIVVCNKGDGPFLARSLALHTSTFRALVLGMALGLTWALAPSCSGKNSGGTSGGVGLLPNGSPCTSAADCQSDICVGDSQSGVKFCTTYCTKQSECTKDFANGCCYPAEPGKGLCAISALCFSHGDAGLGDPCPQHSECSPDLICVYSSDNTVSECTRPCDSQNGCGTVAEECCEPVGAQYDYCVIDSQCGSGSSGSNGSTGGTSGGTSGGTTGGGGDAGPATASLIEDGETVGEAHGVLGSVGLSGDSIAIPPAARNIQLDLPAQLTPGIYHCDLDAGSPDAGGLQAAVFTDPTSSPDFVGLLGSEWQGLTWGLQCGAGKVSNAPEAVIESVDIAITSYAPGHLRTPDGGAARGHATGSATWHLHRGTRILQVQSNFDVDLIPP